MPRPAGHPLAVTADAELVDDLVRLGAEASVEMELTADVGATEWTAAPLVLAGADCLAGLVRRGLRSRSGLLVITRDGADAEVWQSAAALRADAVLVLPQAERLLVERLVAAAGAAAVVGRAPAVAVVPGNGGAGASTLAAALATVAARRGGRPLLVDVDPWGGGLDLLLGAESCPGLRWPALTDARGDVGGDDLRSALPQADGVTVLSWDRGGHVDLPATAAEAVAAAGRQAHDLVVLDVPGRPEPAGAALLRSVDAALLVVTAEVRSAAAAARVAAALGRSLGAAELRVVVRRSRGARLPGAELAGVLGLPLAGEVVSEPGVRAAAERGEPPASSGRGPLARFCRGLLDQLGPAAGRAA